MKSYRYERIFLSSSYTIIFQELLFFMSIFNRFTHLYMISLCLSKINSKLLLVKERKNKYSKIIKSLYILSKLILEHVTTFMSNKTFLSLHTIPIETAYRIFDQLNDKALFLSAQNVCQRLNAIVKSYYRFHVKNFIFYIVRSSAFLLSI